MERKKVAAEQNKAAVEIKVTAGERKALAALEKMGINIVAKREREKGKRW